MVRTRLRFAVALLALGACCLPAYGAEAGKIKDAESASHTDDAARHQIVDTYRYPGFRIVQLNLPVLSHYSYMLISGQEALVVDPDRDVDAYLDLARKESVAIKGVFLTHSHADFVAGHLELVRAVKCPVYQSAKSGVGYKIQAMADGSTIKLGQAVLTARETPGHTPDGMCGQVASAAKPDEPLAILSGDTLFVGSVGRPDLLEGKMTAATLAGMGYDTWHGKLAKLADGVVVLPAHGAGSLCGAHLSDKPSSTIGQERASNPYLQHKDKSTFIAAVLQGLPEAPQYFKHNAAMNRAGPPPVDWSAPPPKELVPDKKLTDAKQVYVADIRDQKAYAAGHIPNSVNIGLRGRFETWIGMMVPWGSKLVLVGEAKELPEAMRRLHRVGYQAEALSVDTWRKAKLPLAKNQMIKPKDLYAQMQAGKAPVVVDVRLPEEWMGLRIGTVVNLPLNRLAELSAKLDPAMPVVAVCNSAYRSSMAVGVLERQGFPSVSSMDGGSEAWIEAGLPVYGSQQAGAAAAAQQHVRLADRLSPAELKRMIMDLPGTFDLVDIRPAEQFGDYRLPGARNANVADLIHSPAYLTGAGPLVIVDRDGSLAMQAAGILSQKTQRTIKALHGGLEAYWADSELKPAVRAVPLAPSMGPAGPAPSAPGAPTRKKSAGC